VGVRAGGSFCEQVRIVKCTCNQGNEALLGILDNDVCKESRSCTARRLEGKEEERKFDEKKFFCAWVGGRLSRREGTPPSSENCPPWQEPHFPQKAGGRMGEHF
jgi:hypothetical protein